MEFILMAGAVLFILYLIGRKNKTSKKPIILYPPNQPAKRKSSSMQTKPQPSSAPAFHWEDDGNYDFEVVGESHYQENLRSLAGDHGDSWCNAQHKAMLRPEDSNPHDNKAVAVYINSLQVGHLSKDDARSFRRRLGRKKLTGQVTSCDAEIRGGCVKDGKRLSYGVWLDMKPFE